MLIIAEILYRLAFPGGLLSLFVKIDVHFLIFKNSEQRDITACIKKEDEGCWVLVCCEEPFNGIVKKV